MLFGGGDTMIGITIALLAIYFALLFIGYKLSDIADTLKGIKKSQYKE